MGSNKHIVVDAIHAAAVPPPYQLAIETAAFDLMVLGDAAPRGVAPDAAIAPPAWFAVALTAACRKRHLYLVQRELDTGLIVMILMFDCSAAGDGRRLRLPEAGTWLRAVVHGTVHVLASDLVLSRKAITAWIGGREPATPAQPPYT